MLRSLRLLSSKSKGYPILIHKQNFLTNDYQCTDVWKSQNISPKINLNDFYNAIDQNFTSKGLISAIDVDVFAYSIKDSSYLHELKDLLHKLRLSAETGLTLQSTHHAVVRNFIEYGQIQELIEILRDPLNYGIFIDDYAANILLDKLIVSKDYDMAATVASLIMLQEDFTNDITCALSQYSCYKHIANKSTKENKILEESSKEKQKIEEIKIRVKYLRNPYYDDHFDIKDDYLLSGKTLAWISERDTSNLNINLKIIGWAAFQKYQKLLTVCEELKSSGKVFNEVIEFLKKESEIVANEYKEILHNCVNILTTVDKSNVSIEESLQITVENAINKMQAKDIESQKQCFETWKKIRENKLYEQTKRLERAQRIKIIVEKQENMKSEEQKLWFFDNESKIDLEIEEKERLENKTSIKKTHKSDDDYIPPEILPKRK